MVLWDNLLVATDKIQISNLILIDPLAPFSSVDFKVLMAQVHNMVRINGAA